MVSGCAVRDGVCCGHGGNVLFLQSGTAVAGEDSLEEQLFMQNIPPAEKGRAADVRQQRYRAENVCTLWPVPAV